jgi:hypothetical protein
MQLGKLAAERGHFSAAETALKLALQHSGSDDIVFQVKNARLDHICLIRLKV